METSETRRFSPPAQTKVITTSALECSDFRPRLLRRPEGSEARPLPYDLPRAFRPDGREVATLSQWTDDSRPICAGLSQVPRNVAICHILPQGSRTVARLSP